jgi:hypothetical protein
LQYGKQPLGCRAASMPVLVEIGLHNGENPKNPFEVKSTVLMAKIKILQPQLAFQLTLACQDNMAATL